MSDKCCSEHTGMVDPELMNHFLNNGNSSSELECKLKLSFETIFDNKKNPLEKIGKLFDIAFKPLTPGACGGGVEPLAEGYLYTTLDSIYGNANYETRSERPSYFLELENTQPVRIDKFYTIKIPLYSSKNLDDIYNMNVHKEVGIACLETWGPEGFTNQTKELWSANYTIHVEKDKFDFLTGKDEIGYGDVITGPFNESILYNYKNRDMISVPIDQIQKGSDSRYYRLKKLSLDKRNPIIIPYILKVYSTLAEAEEARNHEQR